jgi:hypothetical protein
MVVMMRGARGELSIFFYYIVSIIKMIEYLPLVAVAGTMIYAVIHDIYIEFSEATSW